MRANNLLQFKHKVTIEFSFRKSFAQERFKSNSEFRYLIIVSSIKFRKCFAKFMIPIALFMLRLHYVPGGHGSHDFGYRGQNGVTVTQRRGTGSTNVACRDRRDRFLNCQNICHGSHGGIYLLKCAVVERGERNKT